MVRQTSLIVLTAVLTMCLPIEDCWGRGFGGGARMGGGGAGFGGGGARMGGGGFGGGASRLGGGGFGGGAGGGFSGGVGRTGGGGFGGSARGAGGGAGFGGSAGLGGGRTGGSSIPGLGGRGAGGSGIPGLGGGRASASGATGREGAAGGSARSSQVNSFLGLPSDGGTNHVNYTTQTNSASRPNDFDVNRGTAQGAYGGYAAGASVTGPQGNTAYRGGAVGPDGGTAAVRGADGADGGNVQQGAVRGPDGGVAAGGSVTGPDGNTAYRGAAVGPDGGVAATRGYDGANGVNARQSAAVGPYGNAAAGAAMSGPYGGYAARGAYSGRYGAGAGYAAHTPAGRYAYGTAVRSNFNHWGYYGADWYGAHPGAWYAAGWGAGSAWRWATWDSLGTWMAYDNTAPMYYDYGNNITYQNNNVYVNGQETASTNEYYDQAKELAMTGVEAQVSKEEQWMPLGVFALSKTDSKESEITLQIAVNKAGIIRGNDTNEQSNQTRVLQGAVDKKTQRVAFFEGTNYADVFDTGIYNLTKDEAPILLHFGPTRTETWQLTRLKQPASGNSSTNSNSTNDN